MSNEPPDATNNPYRIVARWGDELLDDGFTVLPNLILRYYAKLGMSPAEMMLVVHIVQFQWTEQNPYPSLPGVAERMGLSRRQVNNYVSSLKRKGFLRVIQRTTAEGRQDTNEYDFTGLRLAVLELHRNGAATLKNPAGGRLKNPARPPLKNISTEEYSVEEDEPEEDEEYISNSVHTDYGDVENSRRLHPAVADHYPTGGADQADGPLPAPRLPHGFATAGDVLAQRLPRKDISSEAQTSRPPARRGRPPKAPDYIANVMTDVSLKLHDDHPKSSLTRAVRLWQASGMSEQDFVHQVLYPAQSTTRQQGNVRKPASRGHGLINRVPYFFRWSRTGSA